MISKNLFVRKMKSQPRPQIVRQGTAGIQLLTRIQQRLLILRPVGIATQDNSLDLPRRELRLDGKYGDVDTPFVFASIERAGSVDHDLTLPQRQQSAIQQATGAELLVDALIDRERTEQKERGTPGGMIASKAA